MPKYDSLLKNVIIKDFFFLYIADIHFNASGKVFDPSALDLDLDNEY